MPFFPSPIIQLISPFEFGLGASWTAYPSDQAAELGVVLLSIGLVFLYLGVRIKDRIFRVHNKIGGLAGLIIFTTWLASGLAVILYFDTLSAAGFLVPSPVSPVTYGTAGITFVAILVSAYLRNRELRFSFLSAFAGAAFGAMVFELPFLFIISPRIGFSILQTLFGEAPLFCLVFASYSLVFLSPLAGLSRYTLFSLAAVLIMFSSWAFLTNFAFPSDPVSFVLNSATKILGFVSAFTLFFHKGFMIKSEHGAAGNATGSST